MPPASPERIQHLMAAAENLQAAGFAREAEHVRQMAEQMGGQRPGDGAREGRRSPGFGAAGGDQELRNEVQQMRREMQELRTQLQRLAPHEREGGERGERK